MSEMVEKARKYELEKSMKVAQDDRPVYHFSNPVGWMNDPNGFSDYKGEHHLFFQYYPYATHWDSMHWGHAKSADFIKWEYLPTALAPDQDYDNFGVFSGSAIEDGEKQILIYTGVEEKVIENGKKCIRQNINRYPDHTCNTLKNILKKLFQHKFAISFPDSAKVCS